MPTKRTHGFHIVGHRTNYQPHPGDICIQYVGARRYQASIYLGDGQYAHEARIRIPVIRLLLDSCDFVGEGQEHRCYYRYHP